MTPPIIQTGRFAGLRRNAYGVLALDPPWRYQTWSAKNQDRIPDAYYDTMSMEEIAALPIAELAAPDSILLLWGTGNLLDQQMALPDAWGFKYVTLLTWRKITKNGKPAMGMGFFARTMHEPILLCTRGKPKATRMPSVIDGVRREHSRKPEEFFKRVTARTPGVYRADIFSRQNRPGWDTWGYEAGLYDDSEAIVAGLNGELCVRPPVALPPDLEDML